MGNTLRKCSESREDVLRREEIMGTNTLSANDLARLSELDYCKKVLEQQEDDAGFQYDGPGIRHVSSSTNYYASGKGGTMRPGRGGGHHPGGHPGVHHDNLLLPSMNKRYSIIS